MNPLNKLVGLIFSLGLRVPAHQRHFSGLRLIEYGTKLQVSALDVMTEERRTVFWIRWLFFVVGLLMAWKGCRNLKSSDGHVLTVLFGWASILFAIVFALFSAFVFGPIFNLFLKQWEAMSKADDAKLPAFDLAKRVINLPDAAGDCAFADAAGFQSVPGTQQWRTLHLVKRDGTLHFLFHYAPNKLADISAMVAQISQATGIQLLNAIGEQSHDSVSAARPS